MRPLEMIARLRDRLRRDELSAELDEEIRLHRELLARDAHSARGADRSFGHATYYKEEARAMWSLGIVDDLLHDLRYAARVLRRDAGFTAAVVLTLALGIGANTAAFSIVNAVLLRQLPYADPERLVSVWTSPAGTPSARNPSSLPDILDWQKQATVFSGVAGYASNRFDINLPDGDVQARAVCAAGNVYEVVGARPLLGRMPRGDEEAVPVVAISHRLWLERFGGNPNVLGQVVNLNHVPYTIVGVMPSGFSFPSPDYEMWTTLASIHAGGPSPWLTSRSMHGYKVVARLAPGVSMSQAERAMNAIEKRLGEAYPEVDKGIDIHLQSVRDDSVGKIQRGLWTVFGAAALILLLACVNVAHLLLARLSARDREIAVRRALGAHRGRVVRQLITESVLLGVLGGVAGLAVAFGLMRALIRFSPGDIPRLDAVSIDLPTLGFALAASLFTGLVFGVLPAMLGWGNGMNDALRAQGKGASSARGGRTRAVLTGIEVAFAVLLVVGASLMLRSFSTLTSAKLGVVTADVSVAQTTFVGPRYSANDAKTAALETVLANLRGIPGVTAAGASTSLPPSRIQLSEGFELTGQPAAAPGHERMAIVAPATTGYLEALRIPIERGRAFDAGDDAQAPLVVVISAELARRYFPGVDPVGRQIELDRQTRTIVGVSGDAAYEGVGSAMSPVIYVPFAQAPFPGVWIVIRSSRDAASLGTQVREAVRRTDAELPTHRLMPLDEMVGDSIVRPRFHAWLLGMFGGLALLLASIGIYGVVAYGVAQRRPEIGIRLALGAPSGSVVGMVLRSAMTPVVIGIVAGLGAAYAGARLIAGLLYGIAATDAASFAAAAIALGLAGLIAALVPARRAASVDPLAAIRAE